MAYNIFLNNTKCFVCVRLFYFGRLTTSSHYPTDYKLKSNINHWITKYKTLIFSKTRTFCHYQCERTKYFWRNFCKNYTCVSGQELLSNLLRFKLMKFNFVSCLGEPHAVVAIGVHIVKASYLNISKVINAFSIK